MSTVLRAKLVVALSEFGFSSGVFAEDFGEEGLGLLEDAVEVFEGVLVLF